MTTVAEAVNASVYPVAPRTLEATGLSAEVVTNLVLKTLYVAGDATGAELSRRLGLLFTAIEPILDTITRQHLCEVVGATAIGEASYRYRLSNTGRARAATSLERSYYSGAAPVTLEHYRRYMDDFACSVPGMVTREQVQEAFAHLVLDDGILEELGPAINSGHSIFIYGPPGNGKTVMAHAVQDLLKGVIAIPHAIEVGGDIIRLFDPAVHETAPTPVPDDHSELFDRRWVICRRPRVSVGGELTLDSLSLGYNPRSGVYRAPVQTLANGGILIIDDFGRQRCSPRDLLNWWMVPLESRVEYLALQSGEKIAMPFLAMVIFSTNLSPADLVDEAFLRRIRYKIFAQNPTTEGFIRIFEQCCHDQGIPFDQSIVERLLKAFYRPRQIDLRACHPRDLIKQALTLATYRGQPRVLTPELLDAVCASYFIDDGVVRSNDT